MAAAPARAKGATAAVGSPVSGTAGPDFFEAATTDLSLVGVTGEAGAAGVCSGAGVGAATFLKCATA